MQIICIIRYFFITLPAEKIDNKLKLNEYEI